jgi:nucleotide-binding universal stress UspA family protein
MFDTILVATDGTPESRGAEAAALALAERYGATVVAVYVVDARGQSQALGDVSGAGRTGERAGREATARLVRAAEDRGLSATRTVERGVPHAVVLERARAVDADLIALGSTSGRSALGSTAERVLGAASIPVLAVPPGFVSRQGDTDWRIDAVVVPTDGSDAAGRAATLAVELGEDFGSEVHALYVVDDRIFDLSDAPRSILGSLKAGGEAATADVTDLAVERGLDATGDVFTGTPHEAIRAYAAGVDADLLVMGTRGESALEPPFLGSTTRRVVRATRVPVLTVD